MPCNNEESLVKRAKELGFKQVILYYPKITSDLEARLKNLGKDIDIKLASVENKRHLIIKEGSNRTFFESKKTDIIFRLEKSKDKDFTHQRNSGFNHVLAKLASENNIRIAFSLEDLKKENFPVLIGRILQNIMLAKKYNLNVIIGSFANRPNKIKSPYDLQAFGRVLKIEKINKTITK